MTSAGFTTGSTGTAKDLDNSIASSLANLSAHLSSRFFKSSDEGLLLVQGFFLLDLGEGLGETLLFFFFPAGVVSGLTLAFSPSTLPKTLTCEGSTRVGVGEDETIFFSLFFPSLYVGVASCWTCSGVKALQIGQSFLRTQLSSPTPLSRHLAHFKRPSKITITWPHVPLFCPGDDMMISTSVEIRRCEIKWMNSQINFKTCLFRKHVRTLYAPNKKRCYDVMLSRQEGSTRRHLATAHSVTGPAGIIYRTSFSGVWRDQSRRPVKQLSIG